MHRVFVYGSLLQGEVNHGVMTGARRIGPATTRSGIGLVQVGPYPSLVFEPAERVARERVRGEIYEIDDAGLARLDEFEGHPDWFARIEITLDDGSAVMAYAMSAEATAGLPLIEGGTWRQRGDGPEKNRGPNPIGA
jgi:gamma-glutamylaminecyclotransferase